MNIWEILLMVWIVGVLVCLVYRATGGTCKWFGHDWQLVSRRDRIYECRSCGEPRG